MQAPSRSTRDAARVGWLVKALEDAAIRNPGVASAESLDSNS